MTNSDPIQHLEKDLVSHSGIRSPFFFLGYLYICTSFGQLGATLYGFELSGCYSERCHPDTLKIQFQPPAVAGPNSCQEPWRLSLLVIFRTFGQGKSISSVSFHLDTSLGIHEF